MGQKVWVALISVDKHSYHNLANGGWGNIARIINRNKMDKFGA